MCVCVCVCVWVCGCEETSSHISTIISIENDVTRTGKVEIAIDRL